MIETVAIDQLAPSPTNPRKRFDESKLAELATSIRENGVLQPLLVRHQGAKVYEIIAGERRFRAARQAGLKAVPVVVREMSDGAVLEAQIIENSQREDVDPLEEADGYRLLHEKHSRTVDEIAAKVGKSRASVYARLKLADLGRAGRKALEEGKLTASTALQVARVPAALQADALKAVTQKPWNGELPLPDREVRRILQEQFMLRLKDAPFDVKDATLAPAAGACAGCPKRTGNQKELFGDISGGDVCTDRVCFRAKVDADFARRAESARARGQEVIDDPKALKKLFANPSYNDDLGYAAPYVSLDKKEWKGGKQVPVRDLVGKNAETVLIKAPDGHAIEAVKRSALEGPKVARHRGQTLDASAARQKAKNEIARRVVERAMEEVVRHVECQSPTSFDWAPLARALVEHTWQDALKAIVKRRGLELGEDRKRARGTAVDDALYALITEMASRPGGAKVRALRGLVVELALARSVYTGFGPYTVREDRGIFKAWGVDVAKIEAQETAAAGAAKKAKTARKGKRGVSKTKPSKARAKASASNSKKARSAKRPAKRREPSPPTAGALVAAPPEDP